MRRKTVNYSIMNNVIHFFFKVCVPMHRKGPGGNTSNHGQSFLVGDWERWIKERNPYYFLSIGFCWDVLQRKYIYFLQECKFFLHCGDSGDKKKICGCQGLVGGKSE